MLRRLGFSGRIVLILLLLLIALGLSGIALSFALRGRDAGVGLRLPLPDQAAAIADLIEATPLARRELVLRAVNSDELRVAIVDARPVPPPHSRSLPVAEWALANYLESGTERFIEILLLAPVEGGFLNRIISWSTPNAQTPIRVVMSLQAGQFVMLDSRGSVTQRLFGLPTGFWVGVAGALLGGLAILAIVREAQPLSDLARSVSHFGANAVPTLVKPRGAPDVQALIDAINGMQERIAALLKGRTILLGAVSHDLKTFITRLRLRVEEIADDAQRDKAVADLETMTRLVDDAIAVARVSALPHRRQRIDLPALLDAAATGYEHGRVVLEMGQGIGDAFVLGDEVGLRRILDNLIGNALRYGTHCRIAALRSADAIIVDVDDNGPGIPEPERLAVFEPFYRIEGSRSRETGGSGLGLAIVRQIADAHGISVEVVRAPMGGARFRLRIPVGRG